MSKESTCPFIQLLKVEYGYGKNVYPLAAWGPYHWDYYLKTVRDYLRARFAFVYVGICHFDKFRFALEFFNAACSPISQATA